MLNAKEKSDAEMIAQIMAQVSAEHEVATQVILILPVTNRTLKVVQQVYMDNWIATKYKKLDPGDYMQKQGSGEKPSR